MAMFPVVGARMGGAVAGPVGLFAGAKIGGLAGAVGGGIAGQYMHCTVELLLKEKQQPKIHQNTQKVKKDVCFVFVFS